MKALVVGLGSMGKNHVRIYSELGVLGAVCDSNPAAVATLSAQYGVRGFTNLEEALKESKCTMASVVVPTHLHLSIGKQCLLAGLDVLVEKPIAGSISDGEELVALARSLNRILAVGYIERYNPAYSKLNELVKEGYFGEITSVNIKRIGGINRTADNIVLDLMTHDIDLLLNIFGAQPNCIHLHARTQDGILNSGQALFKFGSASATCESNWISPVKIREIHVTGTKGYVHVDMIKQEITKFESLNITSTKKKIEVEQYFGEPLKIELGSFSLACVTRDTSIIVTGQEGLEALKTTIKTMESIDGNI